MPRPSWPSLCLALTLIVSPPASALPGAACPEAVGISSQRLASLENTMRGIVDEGLAAGVVTYVARHGQVAYLDGVGMADIEAGAPMRPDTMFRIASQTKAVTSVAVMMLVEEGRIGLSDPLSRYLPSFANTQVAVPRNEVAEGERRYETVPARRPITIRDLLTHTSGVPYGFGPTAAEWLAAGAAGGYYADRAEPMAELVERMAGLPIDAQPGERWVYGNSTDILGVVVEIVAGMSLDEFFRERIFQPLKMHDTHFFVPAEKAHRLAGVYAATAEGLRRGDGPSPVDGQGHFAAGPRMAFAGGSGLVSTAMDYGRFLQMILNGGTLDGVRLLAPATVELMRTNHVGRLFEEAVPDRPGLGFGLGFAVMLDPGVAGRYGSPGSFGFAGAYYTTYWLDPTESLVAQFFVQLRPTRDTGLHSRFWTLVYQAITEPSAAGVAESRCH